MTDISTDPRPVILTGDRPIGPLHLGYFCGSLRNRVALQHNHDRFFLIADARALTDNADDPGRITRHVLDPPSTTSRSGSIRASRRSACSRLCRRCAS